MDIFEPLKLGSTTLSNRILRSSVGGKTCNYDGTVTDVWKNFEKRFAEGGVGGVISTTFHVDKDRLSPPNYPSIATRRHMLRLCRFMPELHEHGNKYFVQIGDTGYVTYSSLFPQHTDGASASSGLDVGFGYVNFRHAINEREIERAIRQYVDAAKRVQDAGADGVEITATKGYLIHQFLNPAINRRNDDWGGSPDKRFRLLRKILEDVRKAVGDEFCVGVRLSGEDLNTQPLPIASGRWPSPFLSRLRSVGNDIKQMKDYATRMEALKVNFLHVTAGYAFPNPRDVPGRFPFEEVRMFYDTVRHLSTKAALRATLSHALPLPVWDWLTNIGWKDGDAVNLGLAEDLKEVVGIPVIANGGFRDAETIRAAIRNDRCHGVSMARALIADPDFVNKYLRKGLDVPNNLRCSHCNRCVGRTATSPLGCYDVARFAGSYRAMEDQIMAFNKPDKP